MRMGAPLKVDERERVNSIAEWVGMNEANWAARLIKKKFNFFLYAAVIGYMFSPQSKVNQSFSSFHSLINSINIQIKVKFIIYISLVSIKMHLNVC